MDHATANILRALNNDFYRNNAASFSATRKAGWPGWTKSLELLRHSDWGIHLGLENGDGLSQKLLVLDLACGNLRFLKFLAAALPQTALDFYAVDNCPALLDDSAIHYQNIDLLAALSENRDLADDLNLPLCDLSVCFGFMHHVPGQKWRELVLATLLRQTKPGGIVIVSFWQFLNNPALAANAELIHKVALQHIQPEGLDASQLDTGDFLLGWKNRPGQYRYCHSFSETEIDQLAAQAKPLARFSADGRTNDLNSYLILQRAH